MNLNDISANSLDIQSLLINGANGLNRATNYGDTQTANYAQKGEPMYMAEMDSDEDGTVTLDEFKDYCKDKGIGTRQVVKMSQYASMYRIMKAENEAIDYISKLIPNVHPNLKEANSGSDYLKGSEDQYNISNDANQPNVVKYDEYMKYCEQNTAPQEFKANTAVEETDDGSLKITNFGKVFDLYGKSEDTSLNSTFEKVV